ncbi:MAG: cadherin-like domain-containing protein [Gammaproteobacteria bacterium]|nr:cadherin-like domain-containing protein [Gammaproteobacteria bacterium]
MTVARTVVGVLCALALLVAPAQAVTILIQVGDDPGEGFHDMAPFTPVGGNTATTLGAARLNVFNEAARVWGSLLASAITVRVDARFDPLTCSSNTGTLGEAGPDSIYLRNGYWHAGPLYGALTGQSSVAAISATFSSRVGESGCLGGRPFYLGLDHSYSRSSYAADLLEVVLHELAHGLGFMSAIKQDGTGIRDRNGNDHIGIFDSFVFDEDQGRFWSAMSASERATSALNDGRLVWNGTHVNNQLGILTAGISSGQHLRLYAPASWDEGSSVSHWDDTAAPNLLMEPYATGSTRGYTDLTTCLLYDLGWTGSHCPDVINANSAPVAAAQSVSTPASTPLNITLAASDANGDSLSYSIVAQPAHGTLSGSGNTRTYAPVAGYSGADSFTFQASDGAALSNVATVSITVAAAATGGSAGSAGGAGSGGGGGALTHGMLYGLLLAALRTVWLRHRSRALYRG